MSLSTRWIRAHVGSQVRDATPAFEPMDQPRESSLKKHIREYIKHLTDLVAGQSIVRGSRLDVRDWEEPRMERTRIDAFP